MKILLVICVLLLFGCGNDGSQVSDKLWEPLVKNPLFAQGKGPVVMVDAAHQNFHTIDDRYRPFAELLRKDGFVVVSSSCAFNSDSLARGTVLVISNALNPANADDWALPISSAFSQEEVRAVKTWVHGGGALLLIADHMPFPGAAGELASAFGFTLIDGFALKSSLAAGPDVFRRSRQTLTDHAITRGRDSSERIDSVFTFTGEPIVADCDAANLLLFDSGMMALMPVKAWDFSDETPRIPIEGWSQCSVKEFGKGRVAVVGEAAMFTAQFAGDDHHPVGMNQPDANQNAQFALNLMHWLVRSL